LLRQERDLESISQVEAALAHERAAAFAEVRAGASYNAACTRALLGEKDLAFEWLNKATAAGYQDVRAMLADKDLASLTADPRFRALLPIGEPATFVESFEARAADRRIEPATSPYTSPSRPGTAGSRRHLT